MHAQLTCLAEIRCQQRGIRREVVETLVAFGRMRRRHGADVCFMDAAARRRAQAAHGAKHWARLSDRIAETYLVIADDGRVVTAARRRRRMKWQ